MSALLHLSNVLPSVYILSQDEVSASTAQEQPSENDPLDLLVSLGDIDPQGRYIVVEEVDELLSCLNAQDRAMITLRFFYGMTGAEIAKMLHCTTRRILTRLARIVQRLRSFAQERRKDEEWSVKTLSGNSNMPAKNCCSAL